MDKSSAIQQNSDLLMPIDEDHSNLVKFGADDQNCQAIINFISSVASSPALRTRGGNSDSSKAHESASLSRSSAKDKEKAALKGSYLVLLIVSEPGTNI